MSKFDEALGQISEMRKGTDQIGLIYPTKITYGKLNKWVDMKATEKLGVDILSIWPLEISIYKGGSTSEGTKVMLNLINPGEEGIEAIIASLTKRFGAPIMVFKKHIK
jgi:hypothetical protein